MENHLKMLQSFAEEQVEGYVSDVVNKGTTDAKVLDVTPDLARVAGVKLIGYNVVSFIHSRKSVWNDARIAAKLSANKAGTLCYLAS